MKGGGASAMLSKKIKAEKATTKETFVACWIIKSTLANVSVKDDDRKKFPVADFFSQVDCYIPQRKDHLQSDLSGGFLLTKFNITELLHTKPSWEAMGISKGQLPNTMIFDQYGNEQHPYMTMNGIIIDENSPELIRRMRKIIDFPPSAMLPALVEIEKAYNEVFEEDVRVFRQRGPFHILDKIQQQHVRLQN